MTLKRDAKFRENLTYDFKYDLRNLMNFHPTTQKPESFTSLGSFCELKKGVIFHGTEQWCKIWINPHLVVSKVTRGMMWTFIRALRSPRNYTLMSFFCPNKVSGRKFQRIYVSCNWRVMQNLKENWLKVWIMV